MNNLFRLIMAIIITIQVTGCAGYVKYERPTRNYEVNNSIMINKSKDYVWKKIIAGIGSSFFVINNLDYKSGFINLSYSGNPQRYVDCGIIESFVRNLAGERIYIFPASMEYKEYQTFINAQNLQIHKRKMNLDGRINIVIQETYDASCTITVNTRYILNRSIFTEFAGGGYHNSNDTISFNTNGYSIFPGDITCHATGNLEKEVFESIGFDQ